MSIPFSVGIPFTILLILPRTNLQRNGGIEARFENETQDSEGAPERGLDLHIIVYLPLYRTITAPNKETWV